MMISPGIALPLLVAKLLFLFPMLIPSQPISCWLPVLRLAVPSLMMSCTTPTSRFRFRDVSIASSLHSSSSSLLTRTLLPTRDAMRGR